MVVSAARVAVGPVAEPALAAAVLAFQLEHQAAEAVVDEGADLGQQFGAELVRLGLIDLVLGQRLVDHRLGLGREQVDHGLRLDAVGGRDLAQGLAGLEFGFELILAHAEQGREPVRGLVEPLLEPAAADPVLAVPVEALVDLGGDVLREFGADLAGGLFGQLAVGDRLVDALVHAGGDVVDHGLRGGAVGDGELGQRLSVLDAGLERFEVDADHVGDALEMGLLAALAAEAGAVGVAPVAEAGEERRTDPRALSAAGEGVRVAVVVGDRHGRDRADDRGGLRRRRFVRGAGAADGERGDRAHGDGGADRHRQLHRHRELLDAFQHDLAFRLAAAAPLSPAREEERMQLR